MQPTPTRALGPRPFFRWASRATRAAAAFFAVTVGPAAAQPYTSTMLKDINLGFADSDPLLLTKAGKHAYFTAQTATFGRELWVTDGTTTGTRLVLDIQPGGVTSYPFNLTPLGDGLVFTATTNTAGEEVWYTDGSPQGTKMLRDIRPGATGSTPTAFVSFGGVVLFQADDGPHGPELWRTDGTSAGTYLLADIEPGAAWSAPGQFVVIGDRAYFGATRSDVGREVFVTDGTAAGTALYADIEPGPAGSDPWRFAEVAAGLLVLADTAAFGREPWVVPTGGGAPYLLQDINPGPGDSIETGFAFSPVAFVAARGGEALFVADDGTNGPDLWRTDGSAGGTWFIANVALDNGFLSYRAIVPGRDRFYAVAQTASWPTALWTVYATSGLSGSYTPILTSQLPPPIWRLGDDDTLLVQAYDTQTGYEWYATHGTAAISQFTDSAPGQASAFPDLGVRLGDVLVFPAADGSWGTELHATPIAGSGAWVAEPFGAGCGGPAASGPRLTASGQPVAGMPFGLDLADAPSQSTAVFLLSSQTAAAPTPIGCDWLLGGAPLWLVALPTGATGSVSIGGTLPASGVMPGLVVRFQAAMGQSWLTALSNGVEVVFAN